MAHLRGLGLRKPQLSLAPDFTNLLEPAVQRAHRPTVAVIPNVRMTDMGEHATEPEYLDFLRGCVSAAQDRGYDVVLMGHEAADRRYTTVLAGEFGPGVTSLDLADPIAAKAAIGCSSLVVSSRYHGLVNALSQGIPAIGTSWAHKYAHLFSDYDCRDGLWEVMGREATYARLLDWLEPTALVKRRKALIARSIELKAASRRMWSDVSALLG